MATITKITRRRHENPPHGVASVKEWFNYVTAMRNEGLQRPHPSLIPYPFPIHSPSIPHSFPIHSPSISIHSPACSPFTIYSPCIYHPSLSQPMLRSLRFIHYRSLCTRKASGLTSVSLQVTQYHTWVLTALKIEDFVFITLKGLAGSKLFSKSLSGLGCSIKNTRSVRRNYIIGS